MRKFDDEAQARFLDVLRDTLNVSGAARSVGFDRHTIMRHKEKNPIFAQAWADAMEEGLDEAEESVNRRAFKGVPRAVYHKGQIVGEEIEYSDGLAQFMLKAHRPDKFDKPTKIEGNINVALADRIIAARKRAGI
ncbi:hypothetical protein UFOVP1326_33 [uncultured Caudovirales phage]|uniref:Terminase small subunit n=1 Tax=uncultured Caudovirales phage TaxID=2100421 RepID=A0A6J5RQ74_9CAUD|nr:hypothetical protein UFOVP1326_33 [uncultured Caudovirales phage]CAB4212369.1 hypothetical protein UFOVP1436_6 [uncultured Caudovirales phage]